MTSTDMNITPTTTTPEVQGVVTVKLTETKSVQIRPWKGGDRKKFKKLIRTEGSEITEKMVTDLLVYGCIVNGDSIALTSSELKYILAKIREISVSDIIEFTWTCEECEHENNESLTFDELYSPKIGNYSTTQLQGKSIKFGEIKNAKFYKTHISKVEEESNIVDMVLHIDSVDDGQDFTLDSLLEWMDDISTKEQDRLYNEYQAMSFNITEVKKFKCKNKDCDHEEDYNFEEIPDFFPPSWFI